MRQGHWRALLVVAGAMAVVVPSASSADGTGKAVSRHAAGTGVHATVTAAPPGSGTRAVGTLQYDNDTPFRRLPNTDDSVGNRFDVGVLDPHSIASVSFRLAQNYGGGVEVTVWDVNPPGAAVLRRWYVSGIPSTNVTGVVVSAPLPTAVVGHSGSFIGAVHNTFYTGFGCPTNQNLNGTCDGVALSSGTSGVGPTFHGVYINLSGGAFNPPTTVVGTSGQNLGNANAIFRATGDNLPVELMSLSGE